MKRRNYWYHKCARWHAWKISLTALQICRVFAFSSLYKLRHKLFSTALLAGKMCVGCSSHFLQDSSWILRLFISFHFCLFPTWWSSQEDRVNGFLSICCCQSVSFCLRVVFLHVFLLFQVSFIGKDFLKSFTPACKPQCHLTQYSCGLMQVVFL